MSREADIEGCVCIKWKFILKIFEQGQNVLELIWEIFQTEFTGPERSAGYFRRTGAVKGSHGHRGEGAKSAITKKKKTI